MIDRLALPCPLGSVPYELRRASSLDLEALIALLVDDPIAQQRGDALSSDIEHYQQALAEIAADASNELVVAVDERGQIVAMLQLTRIPGLARLGATRLLLEAVRVAAPHRSTGLGTAMMRWVTDTAAPALDAAIVQLTSDAQRREAHRFYERLGFTGSHVGFKRDLR